MYSVTDSGGNVNVVGVIALVIAREKKSYMNKCLTLNSYRHRAFESPDLTPLDFCLRGCIKNDVYKRKADT